MFLLPVFPGGRVKMATLACVAKRGVVAIGANAESGE
jgi:hypothetical protein